MVKTNETRDNLVFYNQKVENCYNWKKRRYFDTITTCWMLINIRDVVCNFFFVTFWGSLLWSLGGHDQWLSHQLKNEKNLVKNSMAEMTIVQSDVEEQRAKALFSSWTVSLDSVHRYIWIVNLGLKEKKM